jgi:uncharacterized membrane protein YfcA
MLSRPLILLVAGLTAGIINSVAGGGSILIYPLLLSLGLPPINANTTSSIIVWPGTISASIGYRNYLKTLPKKYYLLLIPCLIGGYVGAVLLSQTTNRAFEHIVPWFIAIATTMLILQPGIQRWLYTKEGKDLERKYRNLMFVLIAAFILLISVYGGYFGAGFGLVMLAFLGLTELTNIHQMNGLKSLSGLCVNLTAIVFFIVQGLVVWRVVPFLLTGEVVGGWLGATYSGKLPSEVIRRVVILIGLVITFMLFRQIYFK